MSRGRFASLLTALGILRPAAKTFVLSNAPPETIYLSRNGWVPNHHLPVLLYRAALDPTLERPAARFDKMFRSNGWPPQWRNGVYDFHHYHSTAHEVMGIAGGQARLMLGGEGGHEVTLRAGDVAVLPVGTGHCKLEGSPDLLVVGAYPPDMDWDICRKPPTLEAMERMRRLKLPTSDPVEGPEGSLPRLWSRPASIATAS